jgi:hypothetical protein
VNPTADPGAIPTRAQVEAVLLALIDRTVEPRDAAAWARPWARAEVDVVDVGVWNALLELEGADEPLDPDEEEGPERELLYEEEDFRAWLDDLRAIPPPEPLVTD